VEGRPALLGGKDLKEPVTNQNLTETTMGTTHWNRTAAALTLALVATGIALGRDVDETVKAAPNGEVQISLVAGSVTLIGWDRAEVKATGTIDEDIEEFEITSDGKDVSIEIEPIRDNYRGSDRAAHLEIHVPRGASLDLEAVSAEIDVSDVAGEIGVESVSGTVRIRAPVRRVSVESVSGTIRVDAQDTLRSASFETVSGVIELRGRLASSGSFDFESVSGEVVLRLPADTDAEFDVETFSGGIDNDFGQRPTKVSPYLPGQKLAFTLGSGGAQVSIEVFSGRVRLIKE
jgi:DUF4097 and DUF4098 domain-containing protein YvlB